ncbi:hypothetical protein DRZ77_00030 [Candidatus Woesearchaeota archaeon]|nr:MAG: hypothetical protein DRZ77_00030 [Candidatus Woesearchaeota archaeon]
MPLLSHAQQNEPSTAIIKGTIYDLELNKVKNAIVTVNSTPKQTIVAVNGEYSFELPLGSYKIEAKVVSYNITEAYTIETIEIEYSGTYNIDLILFPNLIPEEEILEEEIDVSEIIGKKTNIIPIVLVIACVACVLLVALIIFYKKKKKRKPFEKTDIEKVIEFIKKEGGRTTQKTIRQHLFLSEAKASLLITEMEHKGLVQKIKKGRGNIIILKEK